LRQESLRCRHQRRSQFPGRQRWGLLQQAPSLLGQKARARSDWAEWALLAMEQ